MGGLIKNEVAAEVTNKCYALKIDESLMSFQIVATFDMNYERYDFEVCIGPYGKLLWVSGGYDSNHNYVSTQEWLLLKNLENSPRFVESPNINTYLPQISTYITPPHYLYYSYSNMGIEDTCYPTSGDTHPFGVDTGGEMDDSLIFFTNDILLLGFRVNNITGIFYGDNLPRNLVNRDQASSEDIKFPELLLYNYTSILKNIFSTTTTGDIWDRVDKVTAQWTDNSSFFKQLPNQELETHPKNATTINEITPWLPPDTQETILHK